MTAQLRILAARLFPERQILLRTGGKVQSISVPGWLQAASLALCLVSVCSVGYLVARFIHAHHTIESRDAVASFLDRSKSMAEATAAEVRSELDAAKAQLADLSSQYDQAESDLAELSEENGKLKGDLGSVQARAKALEQASGKVNQLAKVLEETKADLAKTESQRTALQTRIQQLQSQLQAVTAQAERRKGASALGKALEKFGLGKSKKSGTEDSSDAADSVEPSPSKQALQASEPSGQDKAAAEPAAADAPRDQAAEATVPASGKASQLERLIASTGLDIGKLIGRVKPLPAGEGGPFVAVDPKHAQGMEQDQKRLEELQKLVKTLPLSVPLGHYQVESLFGVRHDPFNGHESFHDGIDMSAPYRTPVYCTGPGTVVYAGSMGDYGRVVEVDHGHGIVSRYAHLHRVLVSQGQKVSTHTEIGELGSSGRATGPHVHYEILIDGEPTDPSKFLQVGKNVVQVGDKQ